MRRRDFLRLSGTMASAPLLLHATPVRAFSSLELMKTMDCSGINERVLVVVQLRGGNDGLNTIVPIDQYSTYASLRPNIRIPDSGGNKYIDLDTTLPIADQVGLHPAMPEVKALYDEGKVNIVQAVAYNQQNKSHFKSTDLWLTGGDGTAANFNIQSGWMGRFLDNLYPGVIGNPSPYLPDPLGIQLGDVKPSLGFHTEQEHTAAINLTGQNPGGFYNLVSEVGGLPLSSVPNSIYGQELNFVMELESSVNTYAQRVTDVFNQGSNSATYPSNDFGSQLKTVARLLNGGSKTKIFLLNISGFDTHAGQVVNGNSTQGEHADLLSRLSQGIKAFQDDLVGMGLEDRVLTVTFSEFGRKAAQNGQHGTDHGTLAPMLLFGKGVEPGMTGTNVDLSDLGNNYQLQNYQHDYRQVFTTLMQDWLGAGDTAVAGTGFAPFAGSKLPLISASNVVDPSCYLSGLLPVELSYFKAEVNDQREVELRWETLSEQNSSHFVIERSLDGNIFSQILEVPASGNTSSPIQYDALDTRPLPDTSYYRLKQVDFDGDFMTFNVVQVHLGSEVEDFHFKIYPNPATDWINLSLNAANSQEVKVEVVAMNGTIRQSRRMNLRPGHNQLKLQLTQMSTGQYVVRLRGGDKILGQQMLVVY